MQNNLKEEEFIEKLKIAVWLSVHLQHFSLAQMLFKMHS